MTLVLVVIHYIFEEHTQNHVDRAWTKFVTPRSWHKLSITGREKWAKATTAALLTYSDTQVITGIAILLAGYWQLSCGISVYHWHVISNLAWFSSVTHIATLTSLRKYFQRRPTLAYCRITAMGINLILLGAASLPANYNSFDMRGILLRVASVPANNNSFNIPGNFLAFPAKCFYGQQLEPEITFYYGPTLNVAMMTASLTFLVTSYIIRGIRISTICSKVSRKWLRVKPGNWVKKSHSEAIDHQARMKNPVRRKLWCFWKRQLTLSYVVFKALYEVGNSTLWEVCSFDTLIIHNFTIFDSTRLTLLIDSLAPRCFCLGDN